MTTPSYISSALAIRANRVLREHVYVYLDQYGLSASSWALLGLVGTSPDGIRLKSAAQNLAVTPPLVTALAEELMAAHLIKRIPHHTDKRAKLLVTTPEGKKLTVKVEKELHKHLAVLLEGLALEDLGGYQKVLEAIVSNGERLSSQPVNL